MIITIITPSAARNAGHHFWDPVWYTRFIASTIFIVIIIAILDRNLKLKMVDPAGLEPATKVL